ncbi:hypothetical protein ACHAPQ_010305 [Fusarium lateritium]
MASEGDVMTLQSSPYLGATCRVLFRDEVTGTVHLNVVPAGLRSSARYHQAEWQSPSTLDMQDIESGTGHVILHFMYSERYQSLEPSDCSEAETAIYLLKLAFKVHAASLSLNLETLQAITENEILKLSDELSFPLVLDVIERSQISFATFPKLAEYLQSHLISFTVDSLDLILSKLETPDTFSMVLLKTIVVLGRMVPRNGPDVDREHYKVEYSNIQSLSEQALEIAKADEEVARKEEQALQMTKVQDEIRTLQAKKLCKGGKLLKKDHRRLELLELQFATYNQDRNKEQANDQSGEALEGEDEQSTNNPAQIDQEPAEVDQDAQINEPFSAEVESPCSEETGSLSDWKHVSRTEMEPSLWVPSASGSVDFLSSSDD